jgi:hypothetical protein
MATRAASKPATGQPKTPPPAWWRCTAWPTGSAWTDRLIREAFHREPAVIQGSERGGWWYWRDALDQQIAVAVEMHTVHHQRRGGWCDYARSEVAREHPQCRGIFGRVYSWTAPPPEAPIPRPPSPWQSDPTHCACGERLIKDAAYVWEHLAPWYDH